MNEKRFYSSFRLAPPAQLPLLRTHVSLYTCWSSSLFYYICAPTSRYVLAGERELSFLLCAREKEGKGSFFYHGINAVEEKAVKGDVLKTSLCMISVFLYFFFFFTLETRYILFNERVKSAIIFFFWSRDFFLPL